jgi:hypothetical protein
VRLQPSPCGVATREGRRPADHADFRTGTRGFAAAEDAFVAVCVRPGTELAFAKPVEYATEGLLGRGRKTLDHRMAIFRQVNKERTAAHHDALEFPDGKLILLTRVLEGQEAVVLQLPARPATASEAESQKRVVHVD